MERKLCSIQEISEITPITNADRIECLHILGWTCVAKKGEFKKGDKVIYCEIDSLIPRKSWSEFLFKDNKQFIRIKTEKLADLINKTRTLVSHIEVTSKVNFYTLTEIANVLGVSVSHFTDESDYKNIAKESKEEYSNLSDKIKKLERENELLSEIIQNQKEIITQLKEKLSK